MGCCDGGVVARLSVEALSTEIEGESKRFCQKCTRFHSVDMFEGTHRTCTEQLIKRQLKAKRPRKLNKKDIGAETEGAASTPLDTEQSMMPSKMTTKRRRASKGSAPASADALTVSADNPELPTAAVVADHPVRHEYAAAVADSTFQRVEGNRTRRSLKMLVKQVTRYMIEECEEERGGGEPPEPFSYQASGMAGAEANAWRGAGGEEDIVGRATLVDSARSTFLESTAMPTDDAFTPLDSGALGSSQQHHDIRRTEFPRLPFDGAEQAMMGWMGVVEHQHQHYFPSLPSPLPPPPLPPPPQQQQRRQRDGLDGGDDSSQYEQFLRVMGGIDGESHEPLTHAQACAHQDFRDHDAADVAMLRQAMLMRQNAGGDVNLQGGATGLTDTNGHDAGFQTSHADAAGFLVANAVGEEAPQFHYPAPPGRRDSDDLDMLTLWAKLDGFSPSDFPSQGLAQEVHSWLRQKNTGAISGHIQPGCTLLTVDCMLPLVDTSQIRTDGVHALAETLLAGPLVGRRAGIRRVSLESAAFEFFLFFPFSNLSFEIPPPPSFSHLLPSML